MAMQKVKRGTFEHRRLVHALDPRFSPTATFTDSSTTPTLGPIGGGGGGGDTNTQATLPATSTSPGTTAVDTPQSTVPSGPTLNPIGASIPNLSSSSSSAPTTTIDTSSSSSTTTSTAILPLTTTSSSSTIALLTTDPLKSSSTVYKTVATSAAVSATNSASSTPAPSGASHTGVIVGAVGGSIIGVAILCALISFILRRWRNRKDEDDAAAAFNSDNFRRSAVLLDDETIAGFDPRPPPTMVEQDRDRPPTFGTTYGRPGDLMEYGYNSQQAYDHNRPQNGAYPNGVYPNYQPNAQLMNGMSPPPSASSANPFFTPAPYNHSPFSPVEPSPVSPASVPYGDHQEVVSTPQVFTRTSSTSVNDSTLSRQPSGNTERSVPATLSAGEARHSVPAPTNDYVDLNRSSVTPFQAVQYVEISKRLSAEVPKGLDTASCEAYINKNRPLSSIADQDEPPAIPNKDDQDPFRSAPGTSDESKSGPIDFPLPPAPVVASPRIPRVDLAPPVLPEIHFGNRGSTSDFPSSVRGSGLSSVSNPKSAVPTSSPLSAGFVISTPEPVAGTGNPSSEFVAQQMPAPAPAPAAPLPAAGQRPQTVYDPEDAYGGI